MSVHLRRTSKPRPARRERSGPAGLHARPRQASEAALPEAVVSQAGPDELRARHAGGPQDQALYGCSCGCAFQAAVSASVRCPRCDQPVAW
jgi:hypothetical protein